MKSKTGKHRITTDKFYTTSETALQCWKEVIPYIKNKNIHLVEPSAGNGSFVKLLKNHTFSAFDIDPQYENIEKKNFFDIDLSAIDGPLGFIGNPPFGRQSSIAKKFIKKITKHPNSLFIAFILPKSFKKESMQKCFPLNYWLVKQMDLPENSFTIDNTQHDVPCVFQIWEKKEKNRKLTPVQQPRFFKWVKKEENPQFSLRRVGVYAGKIDKNIEKSKQSHYFIVLNENIDANAFIESYKTIHFPHDNTAGPKSISKSEFTNKINLLPF